MIDINIVEVECNNELGRSFKVYIKEMFFTNLLILKEDIEDSGKEELSLTLMLMIKDSLKLNKLELLSNEGKC